MVKDNENKKLELLGELVRILEEKRIAYAIIGGYGLDGLVGRLTREHGDIDLLVEDLDIFAKAVEGIWFVEDFKEDELGKRVFFTLLGSDKFYIEAVDIRRAKMYLKDGELAHVLPGKHNAHLGGFDFVTADLEGQEIIERIQTERANLYHWAPYKYTENKLKLIQELRARVETN